MAISFFILIVLSFFCLVCGEAEMLFLNAQELRSLLENHAVNDLFRQLHRYKLTRWLWH